MTAEPKRQKPEFDPTVAAYKEILQQVLANRPSGMRQRLARAIGKNRSFISQIANPAYNVPIPVQHLDRIFEICHFSGVDREAFLAAYALAHPRRFAIYEESKGDRTITVALPDLGDPQKNRKLEALIGEMIERVTRIVRED